MCVCVNIYIYIYVYAPARAFASSDSIQRVKLVSLILHFYTSFAYLAGKYLKIHQDLGIYNKCAYNIPSGND